MDVSEREVDARRKKRFEPVESDDILPGEKRENG
jgi:hypothetical protein